jgi:biopolymer transport protein ExbD
MFRTGGQANGLMNSLLRASYLSVTFFVVLWSVVALDYAITHPSPTALYVRAVPQGASRDAMAFDDVGPAVLVVSASGEVTLDGHPIEPANLRSAVTRRVGVAPRTSRAVVVIASPELSNQCVIDVIDRVSRIDQVPVWIEPAPPGSEE